MGWFIFWVGVNALIGYAIGKPKNNAGGAMLVSGPLGPIGWIIAALSSGNLKTCPFCAEGVRPEAVVCKHCGRDLPAQTADRAFQSKSFLPTTAAGKAIAGILIIIIAVVLVGAVFELLS